MSESNGIVLMPKSIMGKYHNGQTPEPCDMIAGPCACGAWHHLHEWCEAVREIVIRENPWAAKLMEDPQIPVEHIGYRAVQL